MFDFVRWAKKGTTFGGRYPSSKAADDDRHGAPRGEEDVQSLWTPRSRARPLGSSTHRTAPGRVDRIAVGALSTSRYPCAWDFSCLFRPAAAISLTIDNH